MASKHLSSGVWGAITAALLACAGMCSASVSDDEKSLGRQYSALLEKQVKLSADEEMISRVTRVGQAIAAVANTLEVPASCGTSQLLGLSYKFKVVDDEDVNAASLPGGYIYVNTGLIKLAESDDELAGVIAHEVAHAAHRHASHLMNRSASVDRCVALAAIAGILGRARASDLGNILMGAKMLRTGKISGYTQEAENDADRTAVAYLQQAGFEPAAYVRFMRKLADLQAASPGVPMGIFQTHPPYSARIASIVSAMKDLGITADLHDLLGEVRAAVEPVKNSEGIYRVTLCGRVFYQPAPVDGIGSSQDRAEQIARRINSLFDTPSHTWKTHCDEHSGDLFVGSERILTVLEADAAIEGLHPGSVLSRARKTLEYAAWAEWLACATRPAF